jgi:aldose sugar dehydrogenase
MINRRIIVILFSFSSLVIISLTTNLFVHNGESISNASTSEKEPSVINFEDETLMNSSITEDSPEIRDHNLKVEKVFDGLNLSTSMAFLGSNDILVLDKERGTVQRIVNGTMQKEPLLDVPVNNVGGRGMLGIAVAKHENSGPVYVFLYFTMSSSGKDSEDISEASTNSLYRYQFKDDKLTDQKWLLNVSAISTLRDGGHNGGKLRIGPDQNLYLIVGDLREHKSKAQNNQTGPPPDGTSVIYRITQDGKPAPASPLGKNKPVSLFYAYGIRNSFGLDFDPVSGKLWDTENGPNYGDEINLVQPGFNSGWERQQGFLVNSYYRDQFVNIGEKTKPGKYSDPEFVWNQTVAPTALKFLNSDKLGKQYKNDMFVGDAKLGNIYNFNLKNNRTTLALYTPLRDKVANSPQELEGIIFGQNFGLITDMQVGPDGYLYVLTNQGNNGIIYRIVPTQSVIPTQSIIPKESLVPKQLIINLLDNNQIWKPFGQTTLSQNDGTLTVNVDTNNTKKIFNRSFLPTKINYPMNKTLLLNLDYVSKSDMGNATFLAEIIEKSSSYNTTGIKKILWSSLLHNTSGNLTSETFILPDVVANKPVEIRLYVITEGKGEHTLTIKKANIVHL